MDVLMDNLDWNEQFRTMDEYLAEHQPREGAEFTLVKATVYTATTYRVVNGVPKAITLHLGPDFS
jgi:hypothetical protein